MIGVGSTTSAMGIAALGIQRNLDSFNAAAEGLSAQPLGPEAIGQISEMKEAELGVRANAKVFQVANRTTGILVDVLA